MSSKGDPQWTVNRPWCVLQVAHSTHSIILFLIEQLDGRNRITNLFIPQVIKDSESRIKLSWYCLTEGISTSHNLLHDAGFLRKVTHIPSIALMSRPQLEYTIFFLSVCESRRKYADSPTKLWETLVKLQIGSIDLRGGKVRVTYTLASRFMEEVWTVGNNKRRGKYSCLLHLT